MSEAQKFTDQNFAQDVLKSDLPVLVDFWAPWCGPCQAVGPIVEAIATKHKGKVKVGKLNTDENPNTPGKYGIMSIPALIIFKGGQPVNTMVGSRSKAELKRNLDGVLGK